MKEWLIRFGQLFVVGMLCVMIGVGGMVFFHTMNGWWALALIPWLLFGQIIEALRNP